MSKTKRRVVRGAVATALAVATAFAGYAASGSSANAAAKPVIGPGLVTVNVDIHYSHFSLSTLHVQPGTTVQFLVHNNDPINHEFIVGDAAVHKRHEQGHTELPHPPVPGEVSVPPGQVGETFYRFDQPGSYLFACHLPGHLAFGMRGWIVVDKPARVG
jgi:uncharacterized cupredoxin-like copper-binding protein